MDYYNTIYTYLAILAALKWTSSTTGQPDNTTPAHKYPSAVHTQQQCVCTQHNDLPIYERPSTHSIPIGNMYHGDCKLYYQQQYHTAAFLPVLHYHQVGYVINDSNTNVNPCPNFVTEKEDKLITTTARPSQCNKLALFTDIAYKKNVGIQSSLKCPGNVNHDADAAVMAFCSAPDPALWLRGIKVTENCNQLAQYIPVAVFDHQSTYQQAAGILLACNQQVIHIATQNCTEGLHITEVTISDKPTSLEYHVVEWP
ncbi:uncharacterized protein LOC123527218 isoform X1 [Mercenaria mercenaria]|uniref:uncharacterized protein LOC123527218 isoform X1 n=1 Tax=Mercenaria mercenaria TaxID=6596 RepID=UPI00234F0F18|nr:uncharacterized protein LOC123527218 isoform X1 [Mercenaria mercenaria]XP_053379216.1 uncharacterized protein LOC123527218 isoform X1 [Mercenaria mercenaria]